MIPRAISEQDFEHVLRTTGSLWEALQGKSVFFTGATGFVGKWMLEALLRADRDYALGCSVTVLTRSPDSFKLAVPHLATHRSVRLSRGDVRTFDTDPAERWDYVVHAATDVTASTDPASQLDVFDVNIVGTRRVLELARRGGTEGVLITSSGAVYGRVPTTMEHTREDYLGAPDSLKVSSAYGLGKRGAEWLGAAYAAAYDIPVKTARIYALVGPYLPLDGHFAIGNFIKNRLAGEDIVIRGDGTPHRSYLYAADLAVWLWTILIKGESAQAYNVGSDASISLAALAGRVASSEGPNLQVRVLTTATPNAPVERYAPDISKARALGLEVGIDLDEAIRRTLAWHRDAAQTSSPSRTS